MPLRRLTKENNKRKEISMKGRIEHQLSVERNIEEILKGLPEICTDYYSNIAVSKEPMTCQQYLRTIRGFINSLPGNPQDVDLSKIKQSDITRYLHGLAIKRNKDGSIEETSFSYRKLNHSILNSFFKYLSVQGIQNKNLMESIDNVKNADNVKRVRLTAEDLSKIVDGARTGSARNGEDKDWVARNVAIITLFITTGMRETAMSEINVDDLDLKNRKLTVVDKRHKTHTYILGQKVCDCLIEWLKVRQKLLDEKNAESEALFISLQRKRITPCAISNMVKLSTEAGVNQKLAPHKLRAAFCTVLYDKTGDIEFVRDAVGHSSVSVTQRYIVKSDAAKKKSSEIMNELL